MIVWPYAAVLLGAVVLAFGVGRHLAKRRSRRSAAVDVGHLSDAWLAEQRIKSTDRFE
jgi:hypothetical protein